MKHKTNVQKVKAIAKEMEYNTMLQLVVMHALGNYADAVCSYKEKPKEWNDMISWQAWKVASAFLQKLTQGE